MYIARAGNRLIVKRMPGTGSHHTPDCGSYAPEDLSGLGCLLGDAVRVDPDTGDYDRLFWPHRDGLIWPHWRLAGVVVTV